MVRNKDQSYFDKGHIVVMAVPPGSVMWLAARRMTKLAFMLFPVVSKTLCATKVSDIGDRNHRTLSGALQSPCLSWPISNMFRLISVWVQWKKQQHLLAGIILLSPWTQSGRAYNCAASYFPATLYYDMMIEMSIIFTVYYSRIFT